MFDMLRRTLYCSVYYLCMCYCVSDVSWLLVGAIKITGHVPRDVVDDKRNQINIS